MRLTSTKAGADMARRRNKKIVDPWLDAVADAPRTDVEDRSSNGKRYRWIRRYVWASVFLVIPLLFFSVYTVVASQSSMETLIAQQQEAQQADARMAAASATAIGEMTAYLNSDPAPLTGGWVVSWDSAENVSRANPKADDDELSLQLHTMTVADANGLYYSAQVTLRIDDTEGAAIVGEPSIVPKVPSVAVSSSAVPWPSAESITVSEDVTRAVDVWAAAFMGNDPAALRLVVGDRDSNHSYMPLVGVEFVSATVNAATVTADGYDSTGQVVDNPSVVVLNVTLTGDRGQTDEDGSPVYPTYTLDLLVVDADTAAPQVVAWGGTGSGLELSAYVNAISGRSIGIDDDSQTVAPTTDPATEGSN